MNKEDKKLINCEESDHVHNSSSEGSLLFYPTLLNTTTFLLIFVHTNF